MLPSRFWDKMDRKAVRVGMVNRMRKIWGKRKEEG